MEVTVTPPVLDPAQLVEVHRAACRVVAAELAGRKAAWPDPTLAGCSEVSVEGAFVTLKRQGNLRACCGTLGQPMSLVHAVRQAAARTATQDVRLPPIGLGELPYLDLDVTLLHSFRRLPQEPAARRGAVEIGRHGLQLRQGERAGLLLPHVAVEHGFGVDDFLTQVCHKAGLPADAWQAASAELQTFEGVMIPGVFAPEAAGELAALAPAPYGVEDVARLSEYALLNVLAHLTGATPTYYLPTVTDRSVAGVALIASAAQNSYTLSRLALRPGVPLQSTLFQLTEAAAQVLARQGGLDPRQIRTAVAVLEDWALHGTLDQPDLRGFVPTERALAIFEQNQSTWLFDRSQQERSLLDELTELARVKDPAAARLFSLRVAGNAPRVSATNRARPQAVRGERPAAVAGTFYPSSGEQLQKLLDELIPAPTQPAQSWPAAVVPHAGLRFSGRIAAQVWQRLELPPQIVIIGPKHTRLGVNWSVAPHDVWQLPGQNIEADPELAQRLADRISGLELDAAAHQGEHAIEVELPFVARFGPRSRVTGLALGGCSFAETSEIAEGLADVIRDMSPRPLLVVSSDMNHFATDDDTRRLDQLALDAMAQLDPRALYDTVLRHGISMCGVLPAVIVMQTLQRLGGLHTMERVAYGTSGDVSGDRSRVVGYAGVLLA